MLPPKTISDTYCKVAFFDRAGRLLDGNQALAKHMDLAIARFAEPIERIGDVLILQRPVAGLAASDQRWSSRPKAALLIAHFDRHELRRQLDRIGSAYGMTARQVDLVEALMETGSLHEAAIWLNQPYGSARNMLAEIKSKVGLATIPLIVGQMFELASAPGMPDHIIADRHDIFGLSERQYGIANTLGTAKSRNEIAAQQNLSEATVDAEIKAIYLVLGVGSAGEVVRIVAEAKLSLAQADDSAVCSHRHDLPSARLLRDGRSIGYSDYGPSNGRPVIILHSTITARPPPTRLVELLQREGFRPISVDRPGYGDTEVPAANNEHHACAADDLAHICLALCLPEIIVVARGAGQASILLAERLSSLIQRIILVNPMPAKPFTAVDRGPLGAVKRRFARSPLAIEAMIRILAAYATPHRMHDGMIRSFRGSPPDEALVRDDPRFMADYLRATRDFAAGVVQGYVTEQAAWASGLDVPKLPGKTKWRIVQARHFVLHDPAQAMTYWQDRLPDTPVDWVDEAGQMLAYSHPQAIVRALRAD